MLDTARLKWHCRVTSLSNDVIYEDVHTVGGFSVKWRPCAEPWANMKDMHERLWMRQSVLFLSYSFESAVWNERNYFVFESLQSQSYVSGRSRYRGIASSGGFYYLFELVILPDIIVFQILQCCSFVTYTHSVKVKSTPQLQVIFSKIIFPLVLCCW